MGQGVRPSWLASAAPRLAVAGVVMPFWLLGFSTALALTRRGYDLAMDPISLLGAQGAPDPLIWQLGGFLVGGLLQLAYALALWAGLRAGLLAALTAAAGLLLVVSAFAPLGSSLTDVHQLAGLALFTCLALSPLAAWLQLRNRPEWAGVARGSIIVGVVLLVWFSQLGQMGTFRFGLWQRAALVVALGWQVVVALQFRRLAARPSESARTV